MPTSVYEFYIGGFQVLDKYLKYRAALHGLPIVVKDNIDTADRMTTTAGSYALEGHIAAQDSGVAAKLRAAGAIILAKANLSEWANIRSTRSSSGWSARGGQCANAYAIDRNPCGSSSGCAAGRVDAVCEDISRIIDVSA